MTTSAVPTPADHHPDPEPRWPAMAALLAAGGLRIALPQSLSFGPAWLLLAIIVVLSIPTIVAHYRGMSSLNRMFGYLMSAVVTADMIWSLGLLIAALPAHKEAPQDLLQSAAALWLTNIIVFASWYW